MLRVTEVALFLAPWLALLAWWRLGHAGRRLAWSLVGVIVALLALLGWLALGTGFPRSGGYVPAHMQDGRIVPGHGA